MDWLTIVTTVSTSSALIGIAVYFLRRYLDAKIKKIEESNKAQILELTRRQAKMFDQQLVTMKKAMTLVYRARNAAREIAGAPDDILRKAQQNTLQQLLANVDEIAELLYEERAVLPDDVGGALHEIKTPINAIVGFAQVCGSMRRRGGDEKYSRYVANIERSYEHINEMYEELNARVQSHIRANETLPSQ